jgi:hypothetical protein
MLAVLAFLVSVAGCTASPENSGSRSRSASSSALEPTESAGAPCSWRGGRLAVVAGANAFNAGLYELEPCSGASQLLTSSGRISSVGAGGRVVTVAAAPVNVDQVFVLKGRELVPLRGEQAPRGRAVSVGPAGQVAYVSADAKDATVHVSAAGRDEVVYRTSRAPIAATFDAAGDLLVAEVSDDLRPETQGPPVLVRLRAGEVISRTAIPLEGVDGVVAGTEGQVHVSSGDTGPGVTLDSRGDAVGALPAGWRVLLIDDQEGQLLLARAGRLGVLTARPAEPAQQPAGLPSAEAGPVYGAALLP